MTDSLILGVFTSAIGVLTTAITGFIAYKMAQLKNKADEAAVALKKSDAVSTAKIDCIQEIATKTLVHVNDQFLILLQAHAESARHVATLTNDPIDIERAEAAEQRFLAHEKKQKEESARRP